MLRISFEERKAFIAAAALEIFVEKGYKSASLQQIAEKVEITKAGIYHYFKTKEEILHFILVQSNSQNIISLRKVDPANNGSITLPHEMLSHIIRSYANLSLAARDVTLLALRERHQLTGTNLESYQEMEREIFSLLKKKIQAVPRIKSKYEINTIIFMITSMNAWLGYWVKNEGPLSKDEIVEQSIEIICSGAPETLIPLLPTWIDCPGIPLIDREFLLAYSPGARLRRHKMIMAEPFIESPQMLNGWKKCCKETIDREN